MLANNLSAEQADAAAFAAPYHQRWRIEEAFKRLKHRLHLEAVSGLSQQALIIDLAAKVLADSIASLMSAAAPQQHAPANAAMRCSRSYAAVALHRMLPATLLMVGDVLGLTAQTLLDLAANTQRFIPGRTRPRSADRIKPHPRYAYEGRHGLSSVASVGSALPLNFPCQRRRFGSFKMPCAIFSPCSRRFLAAAICSVTV